MPGLDDAATGAELSLSRDERVALARFALTFYPNTLGASAALALGPVDDDLARAVAGDDAGAEGAPSAADLRRLACVGDATGLAAAGWQPATYAPAVVARLVIGRRMPIRGDVVQGLDAIASDARFAGKPIGDLATRHLGHMLSRLRQYAAGGADSRDAEAWHLSGVRALVTSAGVVRKTKEDFRAAAKWIGDAARSGSGATWSPSEVLWALRFLEEECARWGEYGVMEEPIAGVLHLVGVDEAIKYLAYRRETVPNLAREAALIRIRETASELQSTAWAYFQTWVAEWAKWGMRSVVRGELGIVVPWREPDKWVRSMVSAEEVALMAVVEDEILLSGCLDAVEKGVNPLLLSAVLAAKDLVARFQHAAIERFQGAVNEPGARARWARCLTMLQGPVARSALEPFLGEEGPIGDCAEAAFVEAGAEAVSRLLELAQAPRFAMALAAVRALAARETPEARPVLEAALRDKHPAMRWIGIEGLARLGPSRSACEALRDAFALAAPAERERILRTLYRLAEGPHDLAWVLPLEPDAAWRDAWLECVGLYWVDVFRTQQPDDAAFSTVVVPLLELSKQSTRWIGAAESRGQRALLEAVLHQTGSGPLKAALLEALDTKPAEWFSRPAMAKMPSLREPRRGNPSPRRTPSGFTRNPCFSLVAPAAVSPHQQFIVEVFIHDKKRRGTVVEWSSHRAPQMFTTTGKPVEPGTTVDAEVSLPGFVVDHPRTQVEWDGDLGMSQFNCRAPLNPEETQYSGVVTFRVDGVIVGTTNFLIEIGPRPQNRHQLSTKMRVINSAFASYSTEDRSAVLARIQGIQKAVPFMDIFLDVISLRSGDDWRQSIRDAIVARDVLFLFWSQSARASSYVEWEWQTALKENGIDRIEPVPLESPDVAPPPVELQSLHFNDWTLAVH